MSDSYCSSSSGLLIVEARVGRRRERRGTLEGPHQHEGTTDDLLPADRAQQTAGIRRPGAVVSHHEVLVVRHDGWRQKRVIAHGQVAALGRRSLGQLRAVDVDDAIADLDRLAWQA